MNNNELFDALSGIDPKYIDEAAFELHGSNAEGSRTDNVVSIDAKTSRDRRTSIRKMIYIALPSVAAILLIVGVALPAIMRVSKSESAAAPSYDAAAEAPEYDEAAEAPAYDEAAEAEAYGEDSEAPSMAEEAPEAAANEAPAEREEAAAEEAAPTEGAAEAAVSEEADNKKAADNTYSLTAEPGFGFILESAEYKDGILTVEFAGTLPDDIKDMDYSITASKDAGTGTNAVTGTLSDILKDTEDGLTLDISGLNLKKGTYELKIGNSTTEFRL